MAAILTIYFVHFLLNRKANWLEIWWDESRRLAEKNSYNRFDEKSNVAATAAMLKNLFCDFSPEPIGQLTQNLAVGIIGPKDTS